MKQNKTKLIPVKLLVTSVTTEQNSFQQHIASFLSECLLLQNTAKEPDYLLGGQHYWPIMASLRYIYTALCKIIDQVIK